MQHKMLILFEMKILTLFALCLSLTAVAQTTDDKMLSALKEFKNNNYQKTLDILKNEDPYQNLEAFYLIIRAEYGLVTTNYKADITSFDFNQLVSLRRNITNYLQVATNPKGREIIANLNTELLQYPSTETDFIALRNQALAQSQLPNLKKALAALKFDKVIALTNEYTPSEYLPEFEIAYHKAMAQYRKALVTQNTITPEQKKQVLASLKHYRATYSKKNILYDEAIKDAIKKFR